MNITIPEKPADCFRITLNLEHAQDRMDNVLLEALRSQDENSDLKNISRTALKNLLLYSLIKAIGQLGKILQA